MDSRKRKKKNCEKKKYFIVIVFQFYPSVLYITKSNPSMAVSIKQSDPAILHNLYFAKPEKIVWFSHPFKKIPNHLECQTFEL